MAREVPNHAQWFPKANHASKLAEVEQAQVWEAQEYQRVGDPSRFDCFTPGQESDARRINSNSE